MKRSKLLLVSGIIGTLYVIYLFSYFIGINSNASGASEEVGYALATVLVTPHMVIAGIAVIFNWLGFALKARWAALVSAILYAVAILVFIMYFWGVLVEMILCFVAFGKMKKTNEIKPQE